MSSSSMACPGWPQVELAAPLKRGDGVVFDAGAPDEPEQGGAVYDVLAADGRPLPRGHALNPSSPTHGPAEPAPAWGACTLPREVLLTFGPGCVDGDLVMPGSLVWRSGDPELEARLRSTYEGLPAASARRLPVDVAIAGRLGQARQRLDDMIWRTVRVWRTACPAPAHQSCKQKEGQLASELKFKWSCM